MKPQSTKNFEHNINKIVFRTLLSKWYWFLFVAVIKTSTIYLVRNIIPRYEIPINVYAKESPKLLYFSVAFIVLYKTIELVMNTISDLVLRRNFDLVAERLKEFLFHQINRTKIYFLKEQGATAIVDSFNSCLSNYVGMIYTISWIIPDLIMVVFIFSIILRNSKSLVTISGLWVLTSVVTYFSITRDLGNIISESQRSSSKVNLLIANKVKNRELEFFYCPDNKSVDLLKDYARKASMWQERINLRYQTLSFFFSIVLLGVQVLAFNLYLCHLLNSGKIEVSQFQDVFYANGAFCGGVVGNLLRNIPNAIKQYKDSEIFLKLLAPNLQPIKDLYISEKPDILIEDVEFLYNNTRVLNKFSLNIPFGSKVAVVGVPGAGKTTFLNLIAGIVEASKGKIKIGGVDISHVNRESISQNFSYIFEDPKLLPGTLRDNLTMGNEISEIEVEDALTELGLEKWISTLDNELQEISVSNDERKNIMFLRTYLFVKNSSIILADEPTDGMIGDNKVKAFEILRRVSQGKTLIVVGDDFVPLCDSVIFIERRRVYFSTHQQLLNRPSYKALFEEVSYEVIS